MYSLVFLLAFSCLICLSLSFFSLSLFPFIIVRRKRRKEDNDNDDDDDARFCRVYMSGTRSGLYVIIDGVI